MIDGFARLVMVEDVITSNPHAKVDWNSIHVVHEVFSSTCDDESYMYHTYIKRMHIISVHVSSNKYVHIDLHACQLN